METFQTDILTRIARAILFKIPFEMCQFNRIPKTRFKVSFTLQNFSQCNFETIYVSSNVSSFEATEKYTAERLDNFKRIYISSCEIDFSLFDIKTNWTVLTDSFCMGNYFCFVVVQLVNARAFFQCVLLGFSVFGFGHIGVQLLLLLFEAFGFSIQRLQR